MGDNLSTAHVAQRLRLRKATHLKTTLVLGARAGALFRSHAFYQMMEHLAPPGFKLVSRDEQFTQSYYFLSRGDASLGRSEEQLLLSNALTTVYPSRADHCLARLLIQGYFDPVITTNADTLLESALVNEGWQVLRDFKVFNLVSSTQEYTRAIGRNKASIILKLFGEVASHNYLIARRRLQLETLPSIRDILGRDCLVVGLDKGWDADLLYLFPARGDTCWFVMPEEPDPNSLIYPLKETRPVLYSFDKTDGDYENFIVKLYDMLMEKEQSPSAQLLQTEEAPVQSGQMPLEIYISYHPGDEKYAVKLLSHLAVMRDYERLITDWSRAKIEAGQLTTQEIQSHLKSADIILFLVSDDFLASEEIYLQEVEPAMEKQRAGTALVVPLLIRPVSWQNTAFGGLSPLPGDRRFVTQWSSLDSAFLNIEQGIRELVISHRDKKHPG